MSRPEDIPEDVVSAAEVALRQANTKARMLGEPTDPIECIARAILAERERAKKAVAAMSVSAHTEWSRGYNAGIEDAVSAISIGGPPQ